ncbi:MAG: sugar phosphate isomerase/epimerase [Chloroflexi bacterium]|nr:sugar phosphate isomerase/epimerase [Chloroflexota bacterium]
MDRILYATYNLDDITFYRPQAERLQGGLELHMFSEPTLLSSNGQIDEAIAAYAAALKGYSGILGFHGAFYDMVSASLDPEVVALTLRRYRQGLEIASQLGGDYLVFHANYMGGWKLPNYQIGWHERQVAFWRPFAAEAAERGIYVLLENMWAPDPAILRDVIEEVDNPYMRACLDVAHATLYSELPISHWIEVLAPYLSLCHLNNTDGRLDNHAPLGEGIIDYSLVLAQLRALPAPPLLTLEMSDRDVVSASLPYLDLALAD